MFVPQESPTLINKSWITFCAAGPCVNVIIITHLSTFVAFHHFYLTECSCFDRCVLLWRHIWLLNGYSHFVFCTVHCNIIIQYQPTKRTFLIFWYLLLVSNPKVHLQEDSCIYSYGVVRFTCHCATSRTVSGSLPGGVTGEFFRSYRQNHVPWGRLSL